MCRFIGKQGDICTEECDDGLECVETVMMSMTSDEPFDLVLIDNFMAKMNGPVAVEKIRSMGFEGVIIGVTGMSETADVEEFKVMGADDVLCKPIDTEKLKEILNSLAT
jgi:CheY-like chemotaxis protein